MNRERVADQLERLAEEIRGRSWNGWPADEMVVPMNPDNMNEDDWDNASKIKHTPPYDGVLFQMPDPEHDFPCHDCGGQYGPWIKKEFWYHDYASLSETPSINLGISRVRRCTECGHVHFNCYSMGQVRLKVNEESGLVKLDKVI